MSGASGAAWRRSLGRCCAPSCAWIFRCFSFCRLLLGSGDFGGAGGCAKRAGSCSCRVVTGLAAP
eukprot:76179-Pyramimonas_sp.AAC.1